MSHKHGKTIAKSLIAIAVIFLFMMGTASVFAAVEDHTVIGKNPQGTVVNLFDYWTTSQDAADFSSNPDLNSGINKNHALKFSKGQASGINYWTGSSAPRSGMVENVLNSNGYPNLTSASAGSLLSAPLDYLFNNFDSTTEGASKVEGKKAYTNVEGLMQVDEDGYYYYDSLKNFASYDKDSNGMKLYDKPAVKFGNTTGQFFPFNSASQVFDESNGALSAKSNVRADSNSVNHWFGASMSTHFMHPESGKTNHNKDITYEFSGDDDVWVYIDDVLVGDLGGIHDAASLKINFSTGAVSINGKSDGTLKSKYEAAGKSGETQWEGNTYAGGTYHTLKFFYLERGNYASNMSLKFNLKLMPDNLITKVDQYGNTIVGAEFSLYEAERTETGGEASYQENGQKLCSGSTDANGSLILKADDGATINFEELYKKNIGPYYILKETDAPEGYRKTRDIWLHYDPQTGTVTTENSWDTGVHANPRIMVTAPTVFYDRQGNQIPQNADGSLKQGSVFAIVYKKTGDSISGDSNWSAVSGSVLDGWKLHTATDLDQILQGNKYEMKLNSMGAYETTLEELPGDIMTYSNVIIADNKGKSREELLQAIQEKTQYSISYYYTTGDVQHASASNTTRLDTGILSGNSNAKEYDYQYAVSLTVTDVMNNLYVQKTGPDSYGYNHDCIDGVEFALYPEDQTTLLSRITGSDVKLKENAKPVQTQVTRTIDEQFSSSIMYGTAMFTRLDEGTYYLKEISAPSGYKLNENLVKVIVNDNGVFANAGETEEYNGIYVSRAGYGMLLKSMEQFATNDDIDTTLTDMTVKLRVSGAEPNEDGSWSDDPEETEIRDTMHLQYVASDVPGGTGRYKTRLDYSENDEGYPGYYLDDIVNGMEAFSTSYGWPSAILQQCQTHKSGNTQSNRTELGDKDLSHLFVLDTIVTVRDDQVGDLEISKTVKNDSSDTSYSDQEFRFNINLTEYGGMEEDPEPGEDGEKGWHEVYDPLSGIFRYTVRNADGTQERHLTLTTNQDGNGVITLKDGETALIEDLPAEAHYKVTEEADSYWNVSSTVTGAVDPDGPDGPAYKPVAKGEVVTGSIPNPDDQGEKQKQSAAYINTYDPTAATLNLPVEKLFNGWDALDSEKFSMRLTAMESTAGSDAINATMPDGSVRDADGHMSTTISVAKPSDDTTADQDGFLHSTKQFPALTFDHAGTYTYTIREAAGSVPDIQYSNGVFGVVVTVTDDGKGNLEASYEMEQETNDAGEVVPKADRDSRDTATFKNTYSNQYGYIDLRAHKTYSNETGSDVLIQDQFRFMLAAVGDNADSAPMPAGTQDRTVTAGNATGGSISFPTIEFQTKDIGNSYVYQLKEVLPAGADAEHDYTVNGTKYDNDIYYVKIDVQRDTDNSPKPVMTYYLDQNCTEQINADTARKEDHLYESEPGVYRLWFHNSYTAEPAKVSIRGSKTLNGRAMEDGEFTYRLEGADKATQNAMTEGIIQGAQTGALSAAAPAAASGEAGSFAFPELTFTKTGTFTFRVKENIPEDARNHQRDGVTYDTNVSTVTVRVTDKDEDGSKTGTLTAAITYANSRHDATDLAQFVNTYEESGSEKIEGTKNLTGRSFKDGDSFTFTVTPQNGATAPKDSDGNDVREVTLTPNSGSSAAIDFGTVPFDQDGQTYTYTLKEQQPDGEKKGIEYDATTYTLTLKAKANTPKDGTLTIEKILKAGDQTVDEMVWNNAYKPTGSLKLDATKTVTGRKWKADDVFEFELWANADEKLLDALDKTKTPYTIHEASHTVSFGVVKVTAPPRDAADQQTVPVDFEALHFTKASGDGPFEFYITEYPGNDLGMIYDTEDHRIPVYVTDDGQGHLTAKVADNSVTNLNFNNVYNSSIAYSAEAGIVIEKTLNGRDMTDGQFEFTVEAQDSGSGDTAVTARQAAGKLGFGQGETKRVFQSEAAADGTACTVNILEGQTITFDQDDAGRIFRYHVTETKGGNAGYTNDTTEYQLELAAKDLGAGAMEVTTTVTDVTNDKVVSTTKVRTGDTSNSGRTAIIPFTNSYRASGELGGRGSAKIEASKTLNGRAMKKEEFTFQVTNAKDTAAEKTVLATGKNAAAEAGKPGAVDFAEIKYTTKTLKEDVAAGLAVKQGDSYIYQYLVSEMTEDLPAGVSPEEAAFAVTVTVTDHGDGTLSTAVTYPDGTDSLQFVNAYDTKTVSIPIKGLKSLETDLGAAMSIEDIAGKYDFLLAGRETTSGADGDVPMPTLDGKTMTSVKNDRTGQVDFGQISLQASDFDKVTPDVQGNRTRTFEYQITESGKVAGVVNDKETTRTIAVTVTYNSKEKSFRVTGVPDGAAFQFTNVYRISGTDVNADTLIPVNKVLTGRDLKDGEFQFELLEIVDDEAVVIAKGTHGAASAGAASAIDFGKLSYEVPGEHEYLIREVVPAGGRDADTIYDTRSCSVHVSVTDQKDGTLKVTSDVSPEKPLTFTNKQASKDPSGGGDTPNSGNGGSGGTHTKTGDQTPIGMAILMLLISACAGTLLLGLRRSSEK